MAKQRTDLARQLDPATEARLAAGRAAVLRPCWQASTPRGGDACYVDEFLLVATKDAERIGEKIETARQMAFAAEKGAA